MARQTKRLSYTLVIAPDVRAQVWVHDKAYGLVVDPSYPEGYRVVTSAATPEKLEAKLKALYRKNGKL